MSSSHTGGTLSPGRILENHFRRHRRWLVNFISHRFGSGVGEDLVQEAFARTLASGADVRNPRAFLARVAIRAAMEEVRRRPDRFVYEPEVSVGPDAEVAVLLEQTIAALPGPIRDVFVLSRFGGLSNVEIARRCNLSVKRVEARLAEARRRCAALIRD